MKKVFLLIISVMPFMFNVSSLVGQDESLDVYESKVIIDALLTNDAQLVSLPGNFAFRSETDYGVSIQPSDIDFDRDGDIYIFDFGNNRIQQFDKNGGYVRSVPVKDCYEWQGEGIPALHYKSEFVIDNEGNFFVLDRVTKEILKLDKNGNELETISLTPVARKYPALFKEGLGELEIDENGIPYFQDTYYDEAMRKSKLKNIVRIKQSKVEIEPVSSKANFGVKTDNRGRKYEVDRIAPDEVVITQKDNENKKKYIAKTNSKIRGIRILGQDTDKNIYVYFSLDNVEIFKFSPTGELVSKISDIWDVLSRRNVIPIGGTYEASIYSDYQGNIYVAKILEEKNKLQVIRWSKR